MKGRVLIIAGSDSGGRVEILAAIEHPRDYQNPHPSRLVRPGTAPIPGAGIRSLPHGLIAY